VRGVAGVDQDGNAFGTGDRDLEQLQLLAGDVLVHSGQSGDVAAGVREAGDEPGADRIVGDVTTIGIVEVACLAACAAESDATTMTSGASRTSSAASPGRRSAYPSAQRLSIASS
jgi:hypothetical protein